MLIACVHTSRNSMTAVATPRRKKKDTPLPTLKGTDLGAGMVWGEFRIQMMSKSFLGIVYLQSSVAYILCLGIV